MSESKASLIRAVAKAEQDHNKANDQIVYLLRYIRELEEKLREEAPDLVNSGFEFPEITEKFSPWIWEEVLQ